MPRIFVARRIPERGLKRLYTTFGRDSVRVFPEDRVIKREELIAGVQGINALLPILTDTIDAAVMEAAGPQLRIIANYAVGYNNVDVTEATRRRIPVTNTPGVLTETTADLAWALMMAAARRLGEGERLVRASQWAGWGPMLLLGVDVHRRTLGLYGMGRIGQAMARRAQGFDMRVIYFDPASPEIAPDLHAKAVDKAALLAESDFISIHCPLTPETRHSFGAAEFRVMKRTACLINTSRGPVVDEAALAAALKEGEIFAAGIDVYEDEPRVHPDLLECRNAVLLPHLGSASHETRSRMAEIAADNIIARLNGEAPPNCVNPEAL